MLSCMTRSGKSPLIKLDPEIERTGAFLKNKNKKPGLSFAVQASPELDYVPEFTTSSVKVE